MPNLRVDVGRELPGLDLRVSLEAGAEILVLFGPSGAGKTQTLNMIAGITEPDEGEIRCGERLLFRRDGDAKVVVPARDRRIGYVFQDYALFPHRTALENVEFGLRRDPQRREMARRWLDRVGLGEQAGRYPHVLSGGQQQRVAIARALATRPEVLLLDEPFAALDAAVKHQLHLLVREIHQELRIPVLYVTHNLEDAFSIGSRMAILRAGSIEQTGPMDEVLRMPASDVVADLLGIENVLHARVVRVEGEMVVLDWHGSRLMARATARDGEAVIAAIQPEDIKILYPHRAVTPDLELNRMTGTIIGLTPRLSLLSLEVLLDPNGQRLRVSFPRMSYTALPLTVGSSLEISFRPTAVTLLS
ncbi:MAG TPA: ABC transporter ATP-binding protein [Thermoanaerobaculia bacterium]|nr:ABC transporter ATP-binding protein [Thermoanaerobaculia bacterium]